MKVSPAEVTRIADLAELSIEPAQMPELTRQIADILTFVAQLAAIDTGNPSDAFRPGPVHAAMRPDHVASVPLHLGPAEMAPEYAASHYLVPRLEAFGSDE